MVFFICCNNEKPILVVIASYNNEMWAEKNLNSVFCQNYSNYRVIYINDDSNDQTENVVLNFVNKFNKWDKFIYLKRSKNRGPAANRYNGSIMGNKDEIVIILDGDDWLAHNNVFKKINLVYKNNNTWCTYGQYKEDKSGRIGYSRKIPENIIKNNLIRKYDWVTSHLRSYYATLFQKIKIKDLLYNGLFFPVAGDAAEEFPIIEMAGNHATFISDILYTYNDFNQLSEYRVNEANYIMNIAQFIRDKKPYANLKKLYSNDVNYKIDIIINKKLLKKFQQSQNLINIENYFYFDDLNLEIEFILNKVQSKYVLFINNEFNLLDFNHYFDLLKLTSADSFLLDKNENLIKFEKLFDPKTLLENLILFDSKFNQVKFDLSKNILCTKDFLKKIIKNNIDSEICLCFDV